MLLRTRLTIFLSLAFLAVVGGLVVAGLRREALTEQQFADLAIVGQSSLWNQMVTTEVALLTEEAAALVAQPLLQQLPMAPDELRRRLAQLTAPGRLPQVDEVQLVDPQGRLVFSSLASVDARPILDFRSLRGILEEGRHYDGLRQDSPERFVVAVSLPLQVGDQVYGVLTVVRDASRLLDRFSRGIGAPSFLVSLRGRMVRGEDPKLWDLIAPSVPARETSFSVLERDGRLFAVAGVPVDDLAGGVAGTLVTLRDSTEQLSKARALGRIGLIVVGIFVVLTLTALYFYLRRSFRPLESTISVLRALSQGDTNVRVEAKGQGEIRRIADAVTVFRRDAVALAENRQQVERQRRRQERLIRRQMEALASTLEADGRSAVMEDLQGVVARRQEEAPAAVAGEGASLAASVGDDRQLAMLAAVLQRMSSRIADQHGRLTELVGELREAIVTRAKLAGLQQELEIARQLQSSILPTAWPPHANLTGASLMVPAKEVGGDFYDYFFLDERRLAIVVADVSGKGVPAALFMAITRTLLKATTLFIDSPAACIERLNRVLAGENEQMMFVTLVYGILDTDTGRFTYVNAGHNPPLLIRQDGAVEPLPSTGGIAVAVVEEHNYRQAEVLLRPGDTLFLFTDGVTEAFNPREEAFGDERLERLLSEQAPGLPVEQVGQAVLAAIRSFEQGAPQADDITCVTVRLRGEKA